MLSNRDPNWWKSAVVYQVYPRSFADSNGDGIGDLPGIIGRLDYLADLGVDVVWLSPFFASPQDDNGYDISDYEAVDPVFGTMADLEALIAGLHERGMAFVMDLVVNHTSDEHAWFVESRAGTDSPKRDWYWWRPSREAGGEPTNWTSFFSGPAWEHDEHTDEYFLHLFTAKQPDLNWENPAVREAIYAMMRRWVERGVDGFRMDVINMISKRTGPDGELADGHVAEGAASGGVGGDQFLNGPRMHEFLAEMYAEVLDPEVAGKVLLTVGEMPGTSVEEARSYSDATRRELAMVFTFEHMDLDVAPGGTKWDLADLDLVRLKENLARWQDGLADVGWNSLYWNNHDQPRIVSRWGDDGEHRVVSAKAWATVLHLLRGTPYIYQGEELGMTNADFASISDYRDVEALNFSRDALARGASEREVLAALAVKSRDHARTPVQWDDSEHAGFTTGTPWLPVTGNYPEVNAAAAQADPGSVLAHYRQLIALRHELPIVVEGDFRLLLAADPQLFVYCRSRGSERLLVAVNLSGSEAVLDLGDERALLTGEVLLGALENDGDETAAVTLGPWGQVVVLGQAAPGEPQS